MGFADALSAEDRVQVKFSDFYSLVKNSAKMELLANSIKCEVPYQHIREMLTGQNDLLTEYKNTGMIPEQIVEMERLYNEMCDRAKELTKQTETLLKENAELKNKEADAILVAAEKAEDAATQSDSLDLQVAESEEDKKSAGGGYQKERAETP